MNELAHNSTHLLRALLREATYLPDPAARAFIHQHVLSRFRKCAPATAKRTGKSTAPVKGTKNDPPAQNSIDRIKRQQKEAWSGLKQLRKANYGHKDELLKVLFLTYGRIGKRRHELLEPVKTLKGVEGEAFRDCITKTLEIHGVPGGFQGEVPHFTSQLESLLRSQILVKPPEYVRNNPKSIAFHVPEKNIWGHKMPLKRVKGMAKKHYANMLDRVHPPLPREEWERLGRLALNEEKVGLRPERRTRAIFLGADAQAKKEEVSLISEESSEKELEDYSDSPLLQELNIHSTKLKELPKIENLKITDRGLRRLFFRVWILCPTMKRDENKSWLVEWGKPAPPPPAPSTVATTVQQDH